MEAALRRAAQNVGRIKERLLDEVLDMFKPNKEFDDARQQATLELLRLLTELVNDNPTMRFGQVLQNFGFVEYITVDQDDIPFWINECYLEPVELLKRVQERIRDSKNSKG